MKILVVKHGALGDVVRTSWLLPGLHVTCGPSTQVDWLTAPAAADILRFNPLVDRVLTDAHQLRRHYDWVLSLDDEVPALEAVDSVTCDRLSGALLRSGQREYTPDMAPWFDMGLLSRHGKAAADALKVANRQSHSQLFSAMLGIPVEAGSFYNSEAREARWRALLRGDAQGALFGINPFAGGRWHSKALPESTLAALVSRLVDDGAISVGKIIVFSEQPARAEMLMQQWPPHLRRHVVLPDTSESVLDLAAAIRSLDYLVTTDSLGLHLAVAQGIPNLSIYAPTSAAEIETFGTGVKLTSSAPDYCSYRSDVDNSSITVERLWPLLTTHWATVCQARR